MEKASLNRSVFKDVRLFLLSSQLDLVSLEDEMKRRTQRAMRRLDGLRRVRQLLHMLSSPVAQVSISNLSFDGSTFTSVLTGMCALGGAGATVVVLASCSAEW